MDSPCDAIGACRINGHRTARSVRFRKFKVFFLAIGQDKLKTCTVSSGGIGKHATALVQGRDFCHGLVVHHQSSCCTHSPAQAVGNFESDIALQPCDHLSALGIEMYEIAG